MFKPLKDSEKYSWTWHVLEKMKYYKITPARVKRVIKYPERIEEGIVPETVAVMKKAGTKKYQEIWTMYKLEPYKGKQRIKIITAWRYRGKSPARDPVPKEILEEVRKVMGNA